MIKFFSGTPKRESLGGILEVNFSKFRGKFFVRMVGQTGWSKEKKKPTFKNPTQFINFGLSLAEAGRLRGLTQGEEPEGYSFFHGTAKGITSGKISCKKSLVFSVSQKDTGGKTTKVTAWVAEKELVILDAYLALGINLGLMKLINDEESRQNASRKGLPQPDAEESDQWEEGAEGPEAKPSKTLKPSEPEAAEFEKAWDEVIDKKESVSTPEEGTEDFGPAGDPFSD
jgi:hypothetical protein